MVRHTPSLAAATADTASTALKALLGERFHQSLSIRSQFLATEGHTCHTPPWAVIQPQSTEEIQRVQQICHECGIPIIPFGAGSSVEGQLAAETRSLVMDLRGMNRVLGVDMDNMTVRVQCGVTRLQLEAELKSSGLFFPVDPGADATLGGMAATRASGTNAVRYGTMRENTLALEVVLADGEHIRCGSASPKSSNGYDLLHLFVGSEGTLGTITELTLRLFPRPEEVAGAVFSFPDVASAVSAVVSFRQAAIPVARVELLDPSTVNALNRYSALDLPESPLLLVELNGSASAVEEQYRMVCELVNEHADTQILYGDDRPKREQLWKALHKRYYACRALRAGALAVATDVCVPLSRLVETVEETLKDIDTMPVPVTLHGHVGDGNFHTVVLVDENSDDEKEALRAYSHRLAQRAIRHGGTCSGEHGIGIGKQRYLAEEHGGALKWMQRIKQVFDPHGVMNPGKNVDIIHPH